MSAPPNFNALARAYRWMEWFSFGPFLGRCRCSFLEELQSSRAALLLGDGDGRFTARLLDVNPTVQVDAVDASPAMLARLLHNAGPNADRVHTHLADARCFDPAGRNFDLIVSHFFLDCLTTNEVAEMAARLRPGINRGGQWVVSDFAVPKRGLLKIPSRMLVGALYLAFGVLTGLKVRRLPNHHEALSQAGFRMASERTFLGGLLISELWTAD